MFQIYSFCRQVDDIADSDGPRPERLAALQQWRDDIDALYQGHPPARLRDYVASVRRFDLKREDFLAIVDGMEMDVPQDIRAPDLATLDLYCDRVASAVGRLSVRVFGLAQDDGILLAHHLGRALQLTNILRDIDEDAGIGRLYLPREGLLHAGITSDRSAQGHRRSGAAESMRAAGRAGADPFREGRRGHGAAIRAAWCARRGSCRNIIGRSWNCWSREGSPRRARRFASTRWPASPFFFATHSSDAKDRSHHRRWNFGPCRPPFGWPMRISRCMSTRPRNRPAAVAGPISTRRPT